MLSEDHRPHEAFLDEPEHSQTQQTHHLETPGDDNSRESTFNDTDLPKLPLMIELLFGLNGLSLSLLTLPIMYILNTRVAVPLAYLPAYGAIAFLPYSLKPFYAYVCGLWASKRTSKQAAATAATNNNHQYRYLTLFRWLLASNSIYTILLACIPKGGIKAIFVVAFLRGFTDSCAEFCLGLTLIDHARANAKTNNYENTVSSLQAQAATAGCLGSWLASLVTCLVLVGRRVASNMLQGEEYQPQLTGTLTNGLVIATALVQLGGAVSVHIWETKRFDNHNNSSDGSYEEFPMETQFLVDSSAENVGVAPTESDSLRDEGSSHPSYSRLEDLCDEDDESSTFSTEGSAFVRTSSSNKSSISPQKVANWAIVILLQLVLVVIALKGPIVEVASHLLWGVAVVTLLVGLLIAAITICCKLGTNSNVENANGNDMTTFRVGLFFVLKNAVPSESAILASFFYSLFGANQPLLFQFLSFLGMGVSSLSSWSYTKLFSQKFGSGRPLVKLMAVTVALASLASLLHIVVFRIYQSDGEANNGNNSALPSRKLLLVAILSKLLTTFFGEWSFLPELVLATTSVKVPVSANPSQSAEAVDGRDSIIPRESAIISNAAIHEQIGESSNNSNIISNVDGDDQKRIAMEYGTLVSCIDFGDQLGSLLAAPLVAVWQISRDNGFLHLDRLILFCSVANVAVTIGLLPLLWNIGPKPKR